MKSVYLRWSTVDQIGSQFWGSRPGGHPPGLPFKLNRERYQEAERIRLVKIARGEPFNYGAAARKIMAGLGRYMVKWGNELQAYGVAPLPKATSETSS